MGKPKGQTASGAEQPVSKEIVVAFVGSASPVTAHGSRQETTKGSHQNQLTENNNGQPSAEKPPPLNKAKQAQPSITSNATAPNSQKLSNQSRELVKPCQACKALDASERELRDCEDCVYAPSSGKKRGPTPSNQQTPSKKACTKKAKSVHCPACLIRKSEPHEEGKTRKNGKWGCTDCAKLRDEAGLSRPRKSVGLSPSAEPRPNSRSSPTAGRRGTPVARQGRPNPRNSQRATEPSQAAIGEALASAWERQHGEPPYVARRKGWQAASPCGQQQEQNRDDELPTESDDSDSRPESIFTNPEVDFFGTPMEYSPSTNPWMYHPPPYAPAPALVSRDSPASLASELPQYAPSKTVNPPEIMRKPGDPEWWSMSPALDFRLSTAQNDSIIPQQQQPSDMPNYFDSAMENIDLSNAVEASMASRPYGVVGSLDQPQGTADHSNLFQSSAPMPSQVNGVSGSPGEHHDSTGHFDSYSSSGHTLTSVPSDMISYLHRTVGDVQATGDMDFSNAVQASMATQLPGVPGHESTPVWDGNRYDNPGVLYPDPLNLLGPIDSSLSAAAALTPAINFDPEPEAEQEAGQEPKLSGSGIGHPRETDEDAAGAGNETSSR